MQNLLIKVFLIGITFLKIMLLKLVLLKSVLDYDLIQYEQKKLFIFYPKLLTVHVNLKLTDYQRIVIHY